MIGIKRKTAEVIEKEVVKEVIKEVEKEVIKEVEKIVPKPKQNPFYDIGYFVLNGLQGAATNFLEVTYVGSVGGEMSLEIPMQHLFINLQDDTFGGMPEAIVFYTTLEGVELNGIKLPVYHNRHFIGQRIEKEEIKHYKLLVYDLWRVYHYYKNFMVSIETNPNNPIFQTLKEGHEFSVLNQKLNISMYAEQKFIDHFNNKEMFALI